MNYQKFYSELGKLLYAIADVDGKISKKETAVIREIVEKRLVPRERRKDGFGSNVAFYTEIEFDFLQDEMTDPETALESFINYVKAHHTAFTDAMLDDCLLAARDVALAYYKESQKETALLNKLETKLEKIKLSNKDHLQ